MKKIPGPERNSGPFTPVNRASRRLRRAYLYLRRAESGIVVLVLAASFLGVVMTGLLGYLLVQDVALSGKIFPGITIDGRAVGGLSGDDAMKLIQDDTGVSLDRPIVVYHEDREFAIEPASIEFKVDYRKMVDLAFQAGTSRSILERMFRRFLKKPLDVNVPATVGFNEENLKHLLAGVAGNVDYPPESASIDVSSGYPEISSERRGLSVDQEATVRSIAEALPTPSRRIPLVTESVEPETKVEDIGYVVVVVLGEHVLYLYEGERLDSSHLVCTGSEEHPTPTGKFHIYYKEKDPVWKPAAEWAGEQRGVPVPPGPDNPLGGYWMEMADGIGIHATPFEGSLGESVSHGCIRMSEQGASRVYEAVRVGTPVFILE